MKNTRKLWHNIFSKYANNGTYRIKPLNDQNLFELIAVKMNSPNFFALDFELFLAFVVQASLNIYSNIGLGLRPV